MQVNLDIDFTRSEVTEEIVDPEGNALRSEQNTQDVSRETPAAYSGCCIKHTASGADVNTGKPRIRARPIIFVPARRWEVKKL